MEGTFGEIRLWTGSFAPRNWAFCDGQDININENQALYSLIGTIYGGDGVNTFKLPDLRGRTPKGWDFNNLGLSGGNEYKELTLNELPSHSHDFNVSNNDANHYLPGPDKVIAFQPDRETAIYANKSSNYGYLHPDSISYIGVEKPVPISLEDPYLTLGYIICTNGTYPSRN